jgi:hypothetical protein
MSLIEPTVVFAPRPGDAGSERRRALGFGALFAVLFAVAGVFRLVKGTSPHAGVALIALGVAFLVYSLVHPAGALSLRRQWMRFAGALGRVNSVIVLGVLYVLVVTPLGLLLRLFSRRPDTLKSGSYFVSRGEQRDRKHFEHPY